MQYPKRHQKQLQFEVRVDRPDPINKKNKQNDLSSF